MPSREVRVGGEGPRSELRGERDKQLHTGVRADREKKG